MKSPPRYTVDHEVRFASNRDGVELASSVFLPADWSATLPEKGKGNNDTSERSETTRGAEATSSSRDREKHGVVMVHAHPKFGGAPEMMHGLAADMATHGVAVVNLALRGAGLSGGASSWRGDNGEVSDVVTACDHAREALGCDRVHLMGYSFGATVCGGAIDKRDFIATYVAIAYPLGHWFSRGVLGVGAKILMHAHTPALKESTKPKLFLIGTADDFTSRGATERFAKRCSEPWRVETHEGCDHFGFVSPPWCERAGRDARGFFKTTNAYVDVTLEGAKAARVSGGEGGEWFHTQATPVRIARGDSGSGWDEVFEDAASPGAKT